MAGAGQKPSASGPGGSSIFPERPNQSTDASSPSLAKDSAAMGRTPFPAPPSPATPATPARPAASAPASAARRDATERRTLVVGRGISVQGSIQDAERLVVEGTVEATLLQATELSVTQGGVFRGEIEVEDADLAGTIDGTLTVRGNLTVRATGRLIGKTRTRRLQVEDGGQITGHLEMITGDMPERAKPVEPGLAAPHSGASEPAEEKTATA
ncbi:bactofilin family protein [Swaminathania salitolerans]|uniref:Cell shape determination protein CcmA n=1 Tax=Swaminathania salitolerans TaxID=182838 RepID=A0A511BS16_9PROT|nr:polymer-forming cytoskeletal protein [Swaminathania salitolerans]GBQ11787.1 hypothetical protein AA21291_0964 [Swaminathania salitolerans LMG 21291]GEL02623.1 hypothetical protein SSA02_17860 [Swaminathania salitolerans]